MVFEFVVTNTEYNFKKKLYTNVYWIVCNILVIWGIIFSYSSWFLWAGMDMMGELASFELSVKRLKYRLFLELSRKY